MLTKESQKKLTKIRNSGLFCCIEIKSDYNFVWDITLRMAEQPNDVHHVTHKTYSYEDLNEAVDKIYEEVKELL